MSYSNRYLFSNIKQWKIVFALDLLQFEKWAENEKKWW